MKKIYLVMTQTGTAFSKLIKRYTGNTYNHISLALDDDLAEMYSFGRRNAYLFFYGGFVIESPSRGTFKRFKHTIAKVLELSVSEQEFEKLIDVLGEFVMQRKRFHYNFRGLLKARKHIDYQKNQHCFYCSQFVKHLFEKAGIIAKNLLGEVVAPEDFALIEGATVVYEGLLREYRAPLLLPLEAIK